MRRALMAGVTALVLVLVAAVPALAATTEQWEQRRVATVQLEAATADARSARVDALQQVIATTVLIQQARGLVRAATDVSTSAAGVLDATALESLRSLSTATTSAVPKVGAVPALPHGTVGELEDWTATLRQITRDVILDRPALEAAVAQLRTGLMFTAGGVAAIASAELAAAPLASSDSRAAVSGAAERVSERIEDGRDPVSDLQDFTSKVVALRDSQAAAVAAAAAAAAAESQSNRPVPGVDYPRFVSCTVETLPGLFLPFLCPAFDDGRPTGF